MQMKSKCPEEGTNENPDCAPVFLLASPGLLTVQFSGGSV